MGRRVAVPAGAAAPIASVIALTLTPTAPAFDTVAQAIRRLAAPHRDAA